MKSASSSAPLRAIQSLDKAWFLWKWLQHHNYNNYNHHHNSNNDFVYSNASWKKSHIVQRQTAFQR